MEYNISYDGTINIPYTHFRLSRILLKEYLVKRKSLITCHAIIAIKSITMVLHRSSTLITETISLFPMSQVISNKIEWNNKLHI